jgi:hypothetical protein
MGTDIHPHYEIKQNDTWVYYDWKKPYVIGEHDDGSPKYDWSKMFDDPLDIGRNYNLFSILANVRNGFGFAGVPTGEGFKPIALPRGLPTDVSKEILSMSDYWESDGHSRSWFMLKELQDFDWENQFTVSSGIVSAKYYEENKHIPNWSPDSYYGGISGFSVVVLDVDEYNKLEERDSEKEYYVKLQWNHSYKDAVGNYFFEHILTALESLGDPNDVRFVFWFDN